MNLQTEMGSRDLRARTTARRAACQGANRSPPVPKKDLLRTLLFYKKNQLVRAPGFVTRKRARNQGSTAVHGRLCTMYSHLSEVRVKHRDLSGVKQTLTQRIEVDLVHFDPPCMARFDPSELVLGDT